MKKNIWSKLFWSSAFCALFFMSAGVVFQAPAAQAASGSYDVIIVGAGTGGSAAAIQAARMGAKVLLIEDTDWIGGQMTAAAVPNMDEGGVIEDDGIYGEFISKIRQAYGNKSISTCYWSTSSKCFEPSVGQRILKDMITSSGATLLTRTMVTGVTKSGNTVTGVNTVNGSYTAHTVIDATEYGDIISMSGAKYRVGNSTSDSPNASACMQDITYTAVIKKYSGGVPEALKIKTPPPGYDATTKELFARIVSKSPAASGYPYDWNFHNGYRGLPDSSNPNSYTGDQGDKITKTVINWANDYTALYPYNMPAGATNPNLSVQFLLEPGFRLQSTCAAKLKTIQFIYYMQTELGQTDWSVANDEGFNTDYNRQENSCPNIPEELKAIENNMPQKPYVRESKRIVGMQTLTAPTVNAHAPVPNGLALGDYGFDLHQCDGNGNLESGLESVADKTRSGGAFTIPFESFIPESMDGLIAAEKNLSQTRLVNGGTRLQPSTMRTGQAAGAIAAIAAKENLQPRAVNPAQVQFELLKSNDALSTTKFSDMPRTDTNWPYVQTAITRGIMQGNGASFGTSDSLTRRQAAQLIAKRFNLPTNNLPQTASFSDVPLSDPDRVAIEALYQNGITSGCGASPRIFCPNDIIPRWQFAVFLARALNLNSSLAQSSPIFTDVATGDASYPYIQLLSQTGLTIGCQINPNKFCPGDPLTKVQAAIFLTRSLVNTAKISPYQQTGGQIIPPTSNQKAPSLWLDAPSENTVIYKSTVLQGWAIDNTTSAEGAINKIEVFVDNNKVGDATYGSNRQDVCQAYPGRPGCPNVGFKFNLNVASLADGAHTLKISVTDSDTTPKTSELYRNILVNNSVSNCTKVNFSPATSGFSQSASGPVQNTISLSPSQKFYAFMDFGAMADSIWFNNSSGAQCSWGGELGLPAASPGWLKTAAVFSCTAPASPGSYPFEAGAHAGTASNTCDASGNMGTVNVVR